VLNLTKNEETQMVPPKGLSDHATSILLPTYDSMEGNEMVGENNSSIYGTSTSFSSYGYNLLQKEDCD
jgi:hypothetical protein